jgi:hypothetical protein
MAANITTGDEENQSNIDEQGTGKPPGKNKGRVPKAKTVAQQAEQTEAPEKKLGRGRKKMTGTGTSDENEGTSKAENGGEAAKNLPRRGKAVKKIETEKSKETVNEVPERRGPSKATKKAANVVEVVSQEKGKKPASKVVANEDGEPAVKKLRNTNRAKDGKEAKPKRKVRQQKNESKDKDVQERGNDLIDNDDSAQSTDRSAGLDQKELRVVVEHWYV